jgi:hypothetical protein
MFILSLECLLENIFLIFPPGQLVDKKNEMKRDMSHHHHHHHHHHHQQERWKGGMSGWNG